MWISKPVSVAMLIAVLIAAATAGCETAAKRQAREVAEARKDVAREVQRICALPKEEREKELEKLKTESGMVLACGREAEAE